MSGTDVNFVIGYLTQHRGIRVSPLEADRLSTYWEGLNQGRTDIGGYLTSDHDIAVVFNVVSRRNHG